MIVALVAAGATLVARHSAGSDTASAGKASASAGSSGFGTPTGPEGFCPGPEDVQPAATPCIPFDPNKRYAENHAYRKQQPLTAAERSGAQPKADALAAELARLAGTRTDQAAVRKAVGTVLKLALDRVEIQANGYDAPLRNISVGGGTGKVCVNGTIDTTGKATAEVAGRTLDGGCLPSPGGH